MDIPYALLRAGFPYVKTVGMRRLTVNFPMDLAIGKEGTLYILCRNEEGAMVRKLTLEDEDQGSFGSLGTDDGQFRWPVSIIVDREENLFVSDEACHRISKFSKDGEFLGKWGEHGAKEGQLNAPSGIAFDEDELRVWASDEGQRQWHRPWFGRGRLYHRLEGEGRSVR